MASTMLEKSQAGNVKVRITRFALTGALASGFFFMLCWVGTFLPIGPATHMFLELFTAGSATSGPSMAQGFCWSVIFGAVAGGLIGLSYNLLGVLDRR